MVLDQKINNMPGPPSGGKKMKQNCAFNQSEVGEVELKSMVAGQRGVLDDVCYKFTE
jgi:hypothetical protein